MARDVHQAEKKLQHGHDGAFKYLMSHPQLARELFEECLPVKVLEIVDLNTLKITKSSFIDEQLKASASDILYSVTMRDQGLGYLYCLAEHQSTPDKTMALRFLKIHLSDYGGTRPCA